MERLNYTTHALEDLEEAARYSANKGDNRTSLMTLMLWSHLKESQKFILPEGGFLFEESSSKGITSKELDLFILPYKSIALEFSMPKKINLQPNGTMIKDRSLVLAIDANDKADLELFGISEKGYIIWEIVFNTTTNKWYPHCFGTLIPTPIKINPLEKTISGSLLFLGEWGERMGNDTSIKKDAGAGGTPVKQLCCVLNCENVYEEILHAPKMLNKKREKKGKVPFYEYKILKISIPKTTKKHEDGPKGTHASPRQHVRRGHFRRYTDKTIWINDQWIGNSKNGIVEKGYKVEVKE